MNRTFLSRVKTLCAAGALGALLLFAVGSENAAAQFQGNTAQNAPAMGGFTGPATAPNTVAQAKKMWDDTPVVLRGNIVNSLGGEYYTFRDQSGEIMVEIDHDVWWGVQVDPKDTVEIYGEVEKDFGEAVKIDVKRLIKR